MKAMLPGSFDPPTLGHINLIKRASALFDELHVVVADNIAKKSLFTASERVELLRASLPESGSILSSIHDGLTVD